MAISQKLVEKSRMTHAFVPNRQSLLLDHLRSNAFVDTRELSEFVGVSEATIRRDLSELEGLGLVKRTHGGAVANRQVTHDFPNDERMFHNAEEKARIGAVAARLVQDGDAVFIDASTTTLQTARRLFEHRDLTFITNGADIFQCLLAGGATRIFMIGGEYTPINRSFSGALAAEAIRRFNVDTLILSVAAVDLEREQINIGTPMLGETQRAMIEVARKVVVVADHSKFERDALTVVAPLSAIDHIVTDEATRELIGKKHQHLQDKFIFA